VNTPFPVPYVEPISPYGLPPARFETLIAQYGQRISWLKSHSCPCVFAGGGLNGALPFPGSAQRSCQQCFGTGTYWDEPTSPFRASMTFMQMSPTPDEPGVRMDAKFGMHQMAEPSLTIPYMNPLLGLTDAAQPTDVWNNASIDDIFIPVDSLSRYTAVLQVGGQQILPFQQNIQIAPQGAVTTFNTITNQIVSVQNYAVSGAQVLIGGYPAGTNYMVEFLAAPLYVAFRSAGGLPHIRQFGGGTVNEPRKFKVQALDFWTRQRKQQPTAAGSTSLAGVSFPMAVMLGRVVGG
jgi:hypothetical protein